MQRLRTLRFTPAMTDTEFSHFCIRQIVFSKFRHIIPVFHNATDPFAIDFYADDAQFADIEKDMELLPKLFQHLTQATIDFFFMHGKFVECNARVLESNLHLPPSTQDSIFSQSNINEA